MPMQRLNMQMQQEAVLPAVPLPPPPQAKKQAKKTRKQKKAEKRLNQVEENEEARLQAVVLRLQRALAHDHLGCNKVKVC